MNKTPCERTLRRASKKPRNVNARTLYAIAAERGVPMEQVAGLPLWFYGRRIDGYLYYDGSVYFYSYKTPRIPPRGSYYVFTENGETRVARRDYIHTYEKLVGICVYVMRVLPAGDEITPNDARFSHDA